MSRFVGPVAIQEKEISEVEAKSKAEDMKTLKRENRKRRKMIEAYQDMLNHGATGLHPVSYDLLCNAASTA